MQFPVKWTIIRSDLDMDVGRAMAMADHAGDAFAHYMSKASLDDPYFELYKMWKDSTSQGFGTVIVLHGSKNDIERAVYFAQERKQPAFILNDPSYVVKVGVEIFTPSLDVGAVVFGDKNDMMDTMATQHLTLAGGAVFR